MAYKWPHARDARAFDEGELDLSQSRRIEVNRRDPKASLAVRFDAADIERLRQRADAEGIGVTQLVRRWVLERLDEPKPSRPVEELISALEESMRAARAIKRSGTRKAG